MKDVLNDTHFTNLCKQMFPEETIIHPAKLALGPVKHLEANLIYLCVKYRVTLIQKTSNDWDADIYDAKGCKKLYVVCKASAYIAIEELALRFKKMLEV